MTNDIYRELTPYETIRASIVKTHRSKSQVTAYRLLPKNMKLCAERDPGIAFKGSKNIYFPDLFFRNEKILIEIDGGYHKRQQEKDARRDKFFANHGFTTIRIKNEDTEVNVSYWQRILEGLQKCNICQTGIRFFIEELQQVINEEVRQWTHI